MGAQGQSCPGGVPGGLTALRISATTPPTITTAWCAGVRPSGSPAVSQSAPGADTIVWVVGSDDKLYGFDGDTGADLLPGGSATLGPVASIQTPIVANGRIFVAASSQIYAFKVGSN
jgi:hypothetical protein